MRLKTSRSAIPGLTLFLACTGGAFSGISCGSNAELANNNNSNNAGNAGSPEPGSVGGYGDNSAAGSSANAGSPSIIIAGEGGMGSATGTGGRGTAGGGGGAVVANHLFIDPPSATLQIMDSKTAASQTFKAKLGDLTNFREVNATWVLDSYSFGDISNGVFTTNNAAMGKPVGGKAKATASFNGLTVTADITVTVSLKSDVVDTSTGTVPGPLGTGGLNSANRTALQGAPQPDPGLIAKPANPTKILYPYEGTLFPRGLVAPLLQFSPGTTPPEDAKVVLSSTSMSFAWEGYVHLKDGQKPQFYVPQDIWDGCLQSATPNEKITLSVIKAVGGKAYGPASMTFQVAPASLKGVVFYSSYGNALGTPDQNFGLWSVRPGVKDPAKHLSTGCVICHAVSANGTTLTTGGRNELDSLKNSGVYQANLDGSIKKITKTLPPELNSDSSGDGVKGDIRGLSWMTITPNGDYVMRSIDDWWGGKNQKAWKVNRKADGSATLDSAPVVGLDNLSASVPVFSPNGKRFTYVTGDGSVPSAGTPRKSITVMDATIDPNTGPNGTLTFANPKLVLDNGAQGGSGLVTKFPFFTPDNNLLVLQEGTNTSDNTGAKYGGMDASWGGQTGRLFGLYADSKGHVELTHANTALFAEDTDLNYEPTVLPVPAGGYFWIVFMTNREYGNTYTHEANNLRKQLWVAAVSPTVQPGTDPSFPAFFLPNQSDSPNERAYWALEPCRSEGTSCASGDECCNGFCRPNDPNQHPPQLVCKKPTTQSCSQLAEKCASDGDCCDIGSGAKCLGGFCSMPPAPPPPPPPPPPHLR